MTVVNADNLRATLAARLHVSAENAETQMTESILIHQGNYCGRKFTLDQHQLIWFFEEGQIKLVGPQGNVLQTGSAHDFISSQILSGAMTDSYRRAA